MTSNDAKGEPIAPKGDRISKVMARAGLCSRRDAERWIGEGRVSVNGKKLDSPAFNVSETDVVVVDGQPLPEMERTRLWMYHKPKGLVTSNKDTEGRPTVFGSLPKSMPRVISIGRLDINTEGLLLLTNDGSLARHLELPSTGWLRRYRVRAYGRIDQATLDTLAEGIAIDGILYGAIEAKLEREQGANNWITIGLREGKNREVKLVLEHFGLVVNRLIRVSYGPFQLNEVPEGEAQEVRSRVLRDQLGETLVKEIGLTFNGPDEPVVHTQRYAVEPGKKLGRKPFRKPKNRSQDAKTDHLDRLSTQKPDRKQDKKPQSARPGRKPMGDSRPSSAGPNRSGPNRSGPNSSGPSRSGPSRSGPSRSGPNKSGSGRTGSARTGSGRTGGAPRADRRR